jgi:hypothetical protein
MLPVRAVAENQPGAVETKTAMTSDLSAFAARVREFIAAPNPELGTRPSAVSLLPRNSELPFASLALELFALQFTHNSAYRKICEARKQTPLTVTHWSQIPSVPTAAFKELDLSCVPPSERTHVFHSSGTTEQRPSRHFHNAESLAVYEASLWAWFQKSIPAVGGLLSLTPPPAQAPHSSLVHMFEAVRQKLNAPESIFVGHVEDGSWTIDFNAVLAACSRRREEAAPLLILGTAFSFVHLLDYLVEKNLRLQLPAGSRVLETGGYKGRSRTMPKTELHTLITRHLGVPRSHIICEYGMSELSSQAYDATSRDSSRNTQHASCSFLFPPWARAQMISPETGREVAAGETGLLRVFDLANVFSVMAIQTEDLAIRRGDGFDLLGRAQLAEPRGCSLMAV